MEAETQSYANSLTTAVLSISIERLSTGQLAFLASLRRTAFSVDPVRKQPSSHFARPNRIDRVVLPIPLVLYANNAHDHWLDTDNGAVLKP